jgi:hypothetical protein
MRHDFLPFQRGQTASYGLTVAPPAGVAGGQIPLLPTYNAGAYLSYDYMNAYAVSQSWNTPSGAAQSYNNEIAFRPDLALVNYWEYTNDKTVQGGGNTNDTSPQPITLLKLRAVQNGGPAFQVSRRFVSFSTLPYQYGVVCGSGSTSAIAGTAGVACKPIDWAYPIGTTINQYDWFWVIEEGPAIVMCAATLTTVGASVMTDAHGCAVAATQANYPVGNVTIGATYDGSAKVPVYGSPLTLAPWTVTNGASANNLIQIWVRPGIYTPEA